MHDALREPLRASLAEPLTSETGGTVALPTSTVYLNTTVSGVLFQERTGASATTAAGDTDPLGTIKNPDAAQYFVAGSDGLRPPLATESGVLTMAVAGASSLNDESAAIDLGADWTCCALVKGTAGRLFATSSTYRGALRTLSNEWVWYNAAGTAVAICTGDTSVWHVVTVRHRHVSGVGGEAIYNVSGLYNNAAGASFSSFNYNSDTPGLRLLAQDTTVGGGKFTGSLAAIRFISSHVSDAEATALYNDMAAIGAALL